MPIPRPLLTAALALTAVPAHHPHHVSSTMAFFFHLGIAGLLIVSLVDSSFVPLPIPGITDILLVVYAAAHENPFLLVAIATVGSAAGGFLSHAAGQAGGMAFLQKHVPKRILKRITGWMEHHAILSVALPALLPPPMPLSPFVLVAGAVCMKRSKFMTAFTLSRMARHAIAVWLGIYYGKSVLRLWSHISARWGAIFLIVLWSLILIFATVGIWRLYKATRSVRGGKPATA